MDKIAEKIAEHEGAEVIADVTVGSYRTVVIEYPYTYTYDSRTGEQRTMQKRLAIQEDGRTYRAPVGTGVALERKIRKGLEVQVADDELRPDLEQLIGGPAGETTEAADVSVRTIAYVFAMGRLRRGIVTKVAKTRAEVAYTTASSGGRIFRKSVPMTEVYVDTAAAASAPVLPDAAESYVETRDGAVAFADAAGDPVEPAEAAWRAGELEAAEQPVELEATRAAQSWPADELPSFAVLGDLSGLPDMPCDGCGASADEACRPDCTAAASVIVAAEDAGELRCQACSSELRLEVGAGFVDTTSGDDGGTYDRCPDSPTGRHKPVVVAAREPHRHPYVGEGVDGARRSAQVDEEEADMLDRPDPRVELLRESAARWRRQAAELEPAARSCAGDCGLAAAPGDVYCSGCRDGADREQLFAVRD